MEIAMAKQSFIDTLSLPVAEGLAGGLVRAAFNPFLSLIARFNAVSEFDFRNGDCSRESL